MAGLGKSLIAWGLLIAAVGGVMTLRTKIPWIGRLPGDIFIKRENFTFYFPLTTSILLALLTSLLVCLFKK